MGGFQRSVEVYYVVNILTGFGAAPVDSLVQISTTDLFFAHERGTRLSLIALALGTGSYMGPVAAGYITEAQGWRFCFWYLIIFFGIILVLQIFTLEESIYMRPLADPEPHYEPNKGGSKDNGLTGDNPSPLIAQPIRRDTVTTDSTFPIPAQTYWQKMAPIHTQNANPKKWWWLAIFPFRLLTFPAIMWVGIMVGIQIMWLSLLSVTQSELFSVPPYSFGIAVGTSPCNISLPCTHLSSSRRYEYRRLRRWHIWHVLGRTPLRLVYPATLPPKQRYNGARIPSLAAHCAYDPELRRSPDVRPRCVQWVELGDLRWRGDCLYWVWYRKWGSYLPDVCD